MTRRRQRDRAERDLDNELRDHLDRHIAELVDSGMPEHEARRQALREFGGVELAKEECRDVRGGRWLFDIVHDVRFGGRLLRKHRGFTVAAVVALAFGIGASTAVFAIVNATLLRGFPGDPDNRVVLLGTETPQGPGGVSYADVLDWSAGSEIFSAVALYSDSPMTIAGPAVAPDRFSGTYVSTSAFDLLKERPVLGRTFSAADDRPGAPTVVILSQKVWEDRYQSDPGVIGRLVEVNGASATIVGVMRKGFAFPQTSDVWLPMAQRPGTTTSPRDDRRLGAIARLTPGLSITRARAALEVVVGRLAAAHPATNMDVRPTVRTVAAVHNAGYAEPITAVMIAVCVLLLIACANVAGLVLAQSMQRTHEIATRTALGATRWRIARQHLIEGLMLSATAAPLGLSLGFAGLRAFDLAGSSLIKPYWIVFAIDGRVVLFVALVTLAAGVVLGIAPALVVSRTHAPLPMGAGDRRVGPPRSVVRWGYGIVALQLALSLTLLVGAGLILRGVSKLLDADGGVPAEALVTLRFSLPPDRYETDEARLAFTTELVARVRAVPGVTAAAVSAALPFTPVGVTPVTVSRMPAEAPSDQPLEASAVAVTPSYFDAMGTQLLRGRTFDSSQPGHTATVVSARFAATFFPGQDPIGRHVRFSVRDGETGPSSPLTIVGVAPDIRYRRITDHEPVMYLADRGARARFGVLIVRSDGDPTPLVRSVKAAAAEIDPDLPLFGVLPMEQVRAQMRWQFPMFGSALAIFAGLALLISAIGLFAIVSATVSARSYELGVRRALGAQRSQIWWTVLKRSVPAVVAGLVLGLGAALLTTPIFRSLLVRTNPTDLPTFGIVATVLLTAALLACALPAWRATKLDPLVVLRRE